MQQPPCRGRCTDGYIVLYYSFVEFVSGCRGRRIDGHIVRYCRLYFVLLCPICVDLCRLPRWSYGQAYRTVL